MILVNKKLNEFNLDPNDTYVVADFDRTLTEGTQATSWGMIEQIPHLSQEYKDVEYENYKKYRPIEKDKSLSEDYRREMMIEWYRVIVETMAKFKLKESWLKDLTGLMNFREGALEFLTYTRENNIPVIIISAGIGNLIDQELKHHGVDYPNVIVVSNDFEFDEQGVIKPNIDSIINTCTKNECFSDERVEAAISGRSNVILLGDQHTDLDMVPKDKLDDAIKVAFIADDTIYDQVNFMQGFDIVMGIDESYTDLQKLLFQKQKVR